MPLEPAVCHPNPLLIHTKDLISGVTISLKFSLSFSDALVVHHQIFDADLFPPLPEWLFWAPFQVGTLVRSLKGIGA
jgi:hypothetical protein